MSEMTKEEAINKYEMQAARQSAFSLKSLMNDMDIKIDKAFMPAMGKVVSARFSVLSPESEKFTKKKITYFYEKDRECLEKLVQEEFFEYQKRKSEEGQSPAPKTDRLALPAPEISDDEGLFPISRDVLGAPEGAVWEDVSVWNDTAAVSVEVVTVPAVSVETTTRVKKRTARVEDGVGLGKRTKLSDLGAYS
jgi:hypothetical protein